VVLAASTPTAAHTEVIAAAAVEPVATVPDFALTAPPDETELSVPAGSAADVIPRIELPEVLEDLAHLPAAAGVSRGMAALLGTGLLASSGYLLLNTRAGLWLLSLLMARPAWKEFDPLEVIYAWEQEEKERDDDRETLVTLVE
jgi:hypothetical protein